MRRPRPFVRALLALGCAVVVRAEAQRAPSPESVARNFLQAVTEEDWITAAGLLDLPAFRPLVELALERAANWHPPENLTIEDLQRQDPGMPREVAAWQLQRIKESSAEERYDPLNHEFAGVTSADALRALPLDRAAAAWLAAQDARIEIREALTRNRCPVPARDSLARLTRRELLGVVTDPISNQQYRIYAPLSGRVLGMALNQVVLPGFAAYRIGKETSKTRAATQAADEMPEEGVDSSEDDESSEEVAPPR